MAVNPITGAESGDHTPYIWNWSNKSTGARYGALMAHSLAVGAQRFDVLMAGETSAGKPIGFCMKGGPEGSSTLSADGSGISTMPIAERFGHAHALIAPNNTVAFGDYLIPTGTTGQVKPRPAGSNVQPVAKALEALSSNAAEQLLKVEVMTGNSDNEGGYWVSCDATDTLTINYFVPKSGVHVNPGAAKNTPVVLEALQDCVVSNFRAALEVAAGGAKVVNYEFRKGNDAAAANAAAASVTLTITDPAKTAEDNTNTISLTKGQVLVIKITSADVGTAEHSRLAFKVR